VIVSEAAAKHFWPGADPIGRRLFMGSRDRGVTVVGVVPDTRFHDLRELRASFYLPYRQAGFFPNAPTTLAIRTDGPTNNLVSVIRQVVRDLDPGIGVATAVPFENYLDRPLAQPRLNALLLVVFGIAAVLIAAVGLFGTMATMVRQRAREFGVRMALGATGGDVGKIVLRRALIIASAGALLGLLAALAANRLLGALLYTVSPTDGATLTSVTLLLLVIAAIASLVPARSSARVDPVVALSSD
jgi:predicted lysophospholipase L1 biosynthesis ABC-type transport system permease subunit